MLSMATKCPQARQDLKLQEVGREGLLYDHDGELIHILNVTALAIWKACDGECDAAAIESIVREKFSGLDGHDIRGDIERLLSQLEERGLLQQAGDVPAIGADDAPAPRGI